MSSLLVLEGLDGAGTTTQAHRLADALRAEGRRAHVTREPSDGPIGRLIREMLTGGHALPKGPGAERSTQPLDQATFGLLFAADRLDHVQREVAPALAAGTIVLSDRWYHSSLAYQGTGAERAWIQTLNAHARRPDLTIFLRVAPEVAAARRVAAGRAQELFEDLAMQTRVARGYEEVLAELAAAGERIEILDGEQPLDAVTAAILDVARRALR
jgi:dTMP kinase